jgi:hypothetical protein
MHGYAVTVHVAQGLTVDHAYLLADHGLTRELGYTALSRGRHSNHLYSPATPTTHTPKFGPPTRLATPCSGSPVQRSDAAELAIDIDPRRHVVEAERRLAAARAERLAIDQSRWSPRRRGRLEDATRRERKAALQVARARRLAVEQQHGAKPFVTDLELARKSARQVDRVLDRSRRASGRELL